MQMNCPLLRTTTDTFVNKDESKEFSSFKIRKHRRRQLPLNILRYFPELVPVIVQKIDTTTNIDSLTTDKSCYKYLVPYNCTVRQFHWILRNKIEMKSPDHSIYLVINQTLPDASYLIGELYTKYRDNSYLYISYSDEDAFDNIDGPDDDIFFYKR